MASTATISTHARRIEPKVDVAATICALAVLPVVFVELVLDHPQLRFAATTASWIIWLVFAVDFAVKLVAFGRRWLRRPTAWLSLVIVALSYPALGEILASAGVLRVVRATRLVRLIRATRLFVLAGRAQAGLKRIVDPTAMPFVTITVAALVVIGAAAIYVVELEEPNHPSAGDALWWAAATVTTVGYGDVVPKSPAGRAIGIAVMFVGIAFASLLTAQIAAYLTRQEQLRIEQDLGGFDAEIQAEVKEIRAQVAALHEKLDRLLAHRTDASE